MPDRVLKQEWMRRWAWPFTIGMLFALLVITVALSVIVYLVRNDVGALGLASRTSEVATCYAAARGRPTLIVILRGIAAKLDPDPREVTQGFIDGYEASTPTVEECDDLALRRGLEPQDFPAPELTPREPGG